MTRINYPIPDPLKSENDAARAANADLKQFGRLDLMAEYDALRASLQSVRIARESEPRREPWPTVLVGCYAVPFPIWARRRIRIVGEMIRDA